MAIETKKIEIIEASPAQLVEVHLTGKLEKEDYQTFVPEMERLIQEHGKIRLLVVLEDFHGWEAGALWEDVKFDVKHFNDIEKLAIAGEDRWEKGMANFCKPFTTAAVRFFPKNQLADARLWAQQSD